MHLSTKSHYPLIDDNTITLNGQISTLRALSSTELARRIMRIVFRSLQLCFSQNLHGEVFLCADLLRMSFFTRQLLILQCPQHGYQTGRPLHTYR